MIDLRGFGYSGGARSHATIEEMIMDVEACFNEIDEGMINVASSTLRFIFLLFKTSFFIIFTNYKFYYKKITFFNFLFLIFSMTMGLLLLAIKYDRN